MSDFRNLTDDEEGRAVISWPDSAILNCLCGAAIPDGLHVFGDGDPKTCPACGRIYRIVIQVQEPEG